MTKVTEVVDAFQWKGGLGNDDYPDWFMEGFRSQRINVAYDPAKRKEYAILRTLDGEVRANEGDYIIRKSCTDGKVDYASSKPADFEIK